MTIANDKVSVVLAGTGASTVVGETAETSIASVRAGIAGMSELPDFVDQKGNPAVTAAASYIDVSMPVTERMTHLGIMAATEALQPLLACEKQLPVQVIVGLPEPRPGLSKTYSEDVKTSLSDEFSENYSLGAIHCITGGHAAGLMAMEAAYKYIQNDPKLLFLVGGIDSYIDTETLHWLDENDQLHSNTTTWGFCPGEAASFNLLCSRQLADYLKLDYEFELLSLATAKEDNLIKTDSVCVGNGLSSVFKSVLQPLENTGEKISHTFCDMNGEPYRADEFGFSVNRTAQYFAENADFLTPADCWGDIGAASGPLFAALCKLTHNSEIATGNNTLIWASSECGYRSAAVLTAI